jgi:hypothetical protein
VTDNKDRVVIATRFRKVIIGGLAAIGLLLSVAACFAHPEPVPAMNADPTATAPIVVDPATKNSSCPTCSTIAGSVSTVATMAALKALPPPGTANVYLVGYFSAGDGGEGWFNYDQASTATDNGGTVIQPSSLPATGRWIRAHVSDTGNSINVRWFGAKGDGVTNDATAFAAAQATAISIKGNVYVPASSACYIATVNILNGTTGVGYRGDSKGYGTSGSCITSGDATATFLVTATASGNTNNIVVEHLRIFNTGAGAGLKVWNVLWSTFSDLIVQVSGAGIGCDFEGSGNILLNGLQCYGGTTGAAGKFGNGGGTLTNVGPLTVVAGQFAVQGGTGPAIAIEGDPLGLTFINMMYTSLGPTQTCAVAIDGPTSGTPVGSVQFLGVHGESNYNSRAVVLADFCIGAARKFGTVIIDGGNAWGHGDGVHPAQDFVRITAARNVIVRNFQASNLGFTGYSRSMIRLESTFPASGDTYLFHNNIADVSGSKYSYGAADAHRPVAAAKPPRMSGRGTYSRPAGVNRHVERVFNPDRKDYHWGRRKLASDR